MVDLHIHTTATPGHASWEPEVLAATAAARGLSVIAATDHNTTSGVAALAAAGARHDVHVVSGVELDSAFWGELWHTLVYGADPTAPALLALCAEVFARNAADAQRLLEALPGLGFVVEPPQPPGRAPNVAEVAAALARANPLPGRVAGEGDEEAGMRFVLGELEGLYRPVGVDEVIAVAHGLGALAVLAHPGRSKGVYAIPADEADIAAMAAAGLDGIEAYYPTHSIDQVAQYVRLAHAHGLLISGGSDSHHPHQELAAVEPRLATVLERLIRF
jgi:3',5'-nucleoside bisphosphate phosphatase